jgi:hypothetical protein
VTDFGGVAIYIYIAFYIAFPYEMLRPADNMQSNDQAEDQQGATGFGAAERPTASAV